VKKEAKMLKRVLLLVGTIALLAPVALAGIWIWGQVSNPILAQTAESETGYNPAQTITVVGQGSARIEPDIARVSIGVETSAETVAEAVTENEVKMESILAALVELGIKEEDIQTMHYSIQIERYPEPRVVSAEPEEAKPTYRVSNMANVTIRDLDMVGDVLDSVVEAGANNIWGVSFSVDDPEAAQAEARANAIENAGTRAADLATLSGVELGPVMSISEIVGGGPTPMGLGVERAMAGAGPISPGEVEVNYQIQVVYFIEP
jgi:uncharacterized protein YggE